MAVKKWVNSSQVKGRGTPQAVYATFRQYESGRHAHFAASSQMLFLAPSWRPARPAYNRAAYQRSTPHPCRRNEGIIAKPPRPNQARRFFISDFHVCCTRISCDMMRNVFVEILHKISVAVDVQRLEIAHDVAKQPMSSEKFRYGSTAHVLGQTIAFHAMYQEFTLAAHQYASS